MRSLLAAVAFGFALVASTEGAASNGSNDAIAWKTLDEAVASSKDSGKPIFLLIHKSWCGACKGLKKNFAGDAAIEKLATEFEMVNTEDNDEPQGDQYQPDGGYIPRLLFLNSEGTVQAHIKDTGRDQYQV